MDIIVVVGPVTVTVVADEQLMRNNVDIDNVKTAANKENILVMEPPFN